MRDTLALNKNPLLEAPILQSLLKLTIPIILLQLLQAAYQLIDAFWVGRLGGNAVAAVSVTTPFVFLSIAIGAGLAIAGSVLVAQYVGARNQVVVNHVAGQTLLLVLDYLPSILFRGKRGIKLRLANLLPDTIYIKKAFFWDCRPRLNSR